MTDFSVISFVGLPLFTKVSITIFINPGIVAVADYREWFQQLTPNSKLFQPT